MTISNETTHRERYKYLQVDCSWKWDEAVSKLNLFEFLNEILWFVRERLIVLCLFRFEREY